MKSVYKYSSRAVFVVLAFTLIFSPSVSLAQNSVSKDISSLEAAIKMLQEQIANLNNNFNTTQVASEKSQIILVKINSTKVTVKYTDVPTKSYISLLWEDAEGQWNEVGQKTLPKKGGSGKVVVKLTGRDSLTGSTPKGQFKLRINSTQDISWYQDSAVFTMGSSLPKPSCSLKASDEYPGDVGKKVVLTWTSENSNYATMRYEYDNSALSTKNKRVSAQGDKTVQPDDSGTYHFIFYNKAGATECSVHLSYKG